MSRVFLNLAIFELWELASTLRLAQIATVVLFSCISVCPKKGANHAHFPTLIMERRGVVLEVSTWQRFWGQCGRQSRAEPAAAFHM